MKSLFFFVKLSLKLNTVVLHKGAAAIDGLAEQAAVDAEACKLLVSLRGLLIFCAGDFMISYVLLVKSLGLIGGRVNLGAAVPNPNFVCKLFSLA